MQPHIGVLTIGVEDLKRALTFYRDGLGLETPGIVGTEFEYGAVVFFDLRGGLKLALWPRDHIARDATIATTPPSPTDFTLGHNVRTRSDVDLVLAQAERAGARIVKRAADTFWGGYAGYFQDPDGHLWEVLWNPQYLPQEGVPLNPRILGQAENAHRALLERLLQGTGLTYQTWVALMRGGEDSLQPGDVDRTLFDRTKTAVDETVAEIYRGVPSADLETAGRVLTQITAQANAKLEQLTPR